MYKIKEAIIVEGKYDKIKLSSFLDALIIETNGFSIFKDKQKLSLIKTLAEKNGILIITDSDSAGFVIRNYLNGTVDPKHIKHAYINEIKGKERRKTSMSKEGLLGVEGLCEDDIMTAIKKAGVYIENSVSTQNKAKQVVLSDLYSDGFYGTDNSSKLRQKLLNKLELPSKLSVKALLKVINQTMSYEEYKGNIDFME